ncbi:cation:proton antiporter [Halioxenophilus aromaticivorans]|uniref:Sodium:proton antiporter n=1 Tax=Halioxenophilus aromaticivorans TaxID=1306992 RepID=A0AAV3U4A9_9ALTE
MNAWYLLCFLSAFAVLIACLNQHVLKLQQTIAITTVSVVTSLALVVSVQLLDNELSKSIIAVVGMLDFNQLLLNGMLGFLLFAGALEINLAALEKQRWQIAVLVVFSTLLSTFLVGYGAYWVFAASGWPVPLVYCLLFGALISPTDPIAVLAIFKKLQAPESIAVKVEGESLFNDGVGLVVFTTIFSVAFTGTAPTALGIAEQFLKEAVGGVAFGFALAVVAHYLIITARQSGLRVLISMLIPTAGYSAATLLEVSGALAMVVCGIFIGNVTRGHLARQHADHDPSYVQHFWHTIDSFLNALLFLLIGLMLVTFPVTWREIVVGLCMVPVVLLARFISVGIPFIGFRRMGKCDPHAVKILTWGGLRGGLALAMAASIPEQAMTVNGVDLHGLILLVTYVVVIFSIIVQGLTIAPLIQKSIVAANSSSP